MRNVLRAFVVIAVVAGFIAYQSSPVASHAAPTPAPAKLQPLNYVPADATLFLHLDVEQLLASDLGKSMLAAKENAPQLKKALAKLKEETGLTIEQVRTVTMYWPQFSDLSDSQKVKIGMIFTLTDAFDLAAFAKKAKDYADGKGKFEEGKDYVQLTNEKRKESIRVDCSVPNQVILLAGLDAKYVKPQPADAKGALSALIQSAGEGNVFTGGLNMLNLPEEIRSDDLPIFVKPFSPILKSEIMALSMRLAKDDLVVTLATTTKDKAAAGEVEKSYDVGRKLLLMQLDEAQKELAKTEDPELKPFPDLVKLFAKILTDASISTDGNRALAALKVPNKTNLTPVAELIFGGRQAKTAQQQNNLKQIGLAMHNYHDAIGMFPPAATIDKKGKPLLSWRVAILPYVEQAALYEKFKHDEPWDSDHNKKVMEENPMPAVFRLPGDDDDKSRDTHCQVFTGEGAMFEAGMALKIQNIPDGTSNTLMVGLAAKAVPWTKPGDIEFDAKQDPRKLLLFTNDKTSVAFADGSVRMLKKSMAEETWKALITRAGGETVSLDE
jgi:hypothetical protein